MQNLAVTLMRGFVVFPNLRYLYFWRLDKLAEELRDRSVPQSTLVMYLMLFLVGQAEGLLNLVVGIAWCCCELLGLVGLKSVEGIGQIWEEQHLAPIVSIFLNKTNADIVLYSYLSRIAVTVIMVVMCYRTNKAGDDEDFITRFVCLAFPASVRMVVAKFVVSLVVSLLFHIFAIQITAMSSITVEIVQSVIIGIFCTIFFYYRYIYRGMAIAAGTHKPTKENA